MAGPQRIEDHDGANGIQGAHKIEMKMKTLDAKTPSSAANQMYFHKDSGDTYASHNSPPTPKVPGKYSARTETAEAVFRELLSLGDAPRTREYVPEPDRLEHFPTEFKPVQVVPDAPGIDRLDAPPQTVNRPSPRPLRSPVRQQPKPFNPPARGGSFMPDNAVLSMLLNIGALLVLFAIVFLIMQIPGMTKNNSIHITQKYSLHLSPLPLWFNSGCALLATIVMLRIILHRLKYALGLVVGVPVGLNVVLSQGMEGFVVYGILFGCGISLLCLLLLLLQGKIGLTIGETVLVSIVTALSLMPITGYGMHFMAALGIGTVAGALTQAALFLYVLLAAGGRRSREPEVRSQESEWETLAFISQQPSAKGVPPVPGGAWSRTDVRSRRSLRAE